jgi:sec-independent protein translocase protein TatA
MGELSPTHWLIVILVALVLFGGKRLPEMARGLGRSARILKAELSGTAGDTPPAPEHGGPAEPAGPPDSGRAATG